MTGHQKKICVFKQHIFYKADKKNDIIILLAKFNEPDFKIYLSACNILSTYSGIVLTLNYKL